MSPNPPLHRRLPGVRFEVPPPALDEALPRMDIAFFVGFATRGPVGRAVAVESLVEFEAAFGREIVLARDARTLEPVRGLLHPCVRSFFSQGGRRCWVLRVAGSDVRTGVFALPALLLARRAGPDWRLEPALLQARDPGSGADRLQVGVRTDAAVIRVQPEALASPDPGGTLALRASASAAQQVRVDDLLRVALGDLRVHGRVTALEDGEPDAGGRPMRRLVVQGFVALRALDRLDDTAWAERVELDDAGQSALPRRFAVRAQPRPDGTQALLAHLPAARIPRAGAVLRLLSAAGDDIGWMALDRVELVDVSALDGQVDLMLGGPVWSNAHADGLRAVDAWRERGDEQLAQRLRLTLRADDGEAAQPFEATSLGLADGAGSAFDLPARSPLAAPAAPAPWLLLPLSDAAGFGPAVGPLPSPLTPLQRDGLADFSWALFAEPTLAACPSDALADRAEAMRLAGRVPRALRGMHALFGGEATAVVDEPTLLAVPDAVHPGWVPLRQPEAPWLELPPLPEPPDTCAGEAFISCDATPLPRPRFVRGADPGPDGRFTLHWTLVAEGATHELEESADPGFAAATRVHDGTAQRFTVLGKKPGRLYYRVRARLGTRRSPWSAPVRIEIGAVGYETRPWQPRELLALHRLMLRTAASRGDLLAVLTLPEAYDTATAAAHAATLRDPQARSEAADPPPIGADEMRALSHGALYHPWLVIRRVDQVIRFAPDGAVCGQLAAGAFSRGTWIAMANKPLRDVVALGAPGMEPTLAQRQQLLDAQVNLLRSAPHGFVVSSADTLTPDSAWRPVNVRRLMCLLRRLALRRGATYVFEPNGTTLRRTVERGFRAVLDDLFRRGAFAGAQAGDAYRVEVGDTLNTPQRRDLGQFWVELKVAPALPLSFLTVRLSRQGERVVSREVH